MREWVNDLRIGGGLALAGGRSALTRLVLAALGAGLGVTIMLLAAALPHAIDAHLARADDRTPRFGVTDPTHRLLGAQATTDYHGRSIRVVYLRAPGSEPPRPPGVRQLPGPGQLVASPALAHLLAEPDGRLLRPRFPGHSVGTVGPAGLAGPTDLIAYVYSDARPPVLQAIAGFGASGSWTPLPPIFTALIVIGVTVLLFPVFVFVLTATRLSGTERDRQLAAIRLIGADSRQARRIAAAEALLSSIGGLLLGAVGFLLARPLVARVQLQGESVFSRDLVPGPVAVAAVAALVPLVTVGAALFAQRRTVIEPLGVVRQAGTRRRRLWWRLLPAVLGAGLLATASRTGSSTRLVVAVCALLATIPLLLPWVVEAVIRYVHPASPAAQLGTGRLRLDAGTPARVVAGVAVALAGATALASILTVVARPYHQAARSASRTGYVTAELQAPARPVRLSRVPGVEGAIAGNQLDLAWVDAVVMTCPNVDVAFPGARCRDGQVFAGGTTRVRSGQAGNPGWVVPPLQPARTDWATLQGVLVITPGAARPGWYNPGDQTLTVRYRAGGETLDRLYNAFAPLGPAATVYVESGPDADDVSDQAATFREIRTALYAGAGLTLLVAAATMLVLGVEQTRERRRPLAALAAAGVPRSVLTRSVLWQNAIPLAAGVLVADAVGAVLAGLFLRLEHEQVAVDWAGMAGLTGLAVAVVAATTLLTLPAIRQATRPAMLRAE